jgi:hypothetical protein
MDWHPAPGKRFVGVRLGAVDCVDRTEIITPCTTSVVLHNCKYALVTRRHEGDHGRQALQADCLSEGLLSSVGKFLVWKNGRWA